MTTTSPTAEADVMAFIKATAADLAQRFPQLTDINIQLASQYTPVTITAYQEREFRMASANTLVDAVAQLAEVVVSKDRLIAEKRAKAEALAKEIAALEEGQIT